MDYMKKNLLCAAIFIGLVGGIPTASQTPVRAAELVPQGEFADLGVSPSNPPTPRPIRLKGEEQVKVVGSGSGRWQFAIRWMDEPSGTTVRVAGRAFLRHETKSKSSKEKRLAFTRAGDEEFSSAKTFSFSLFDDSQKFGLGPGSTQFTLNVGGTGGFETPRFQDTLTSQWRVVPEPLTILGSMAAVGFGIALKKRLASSQQT